ncbi:hypothetical protein [uncultured Endozoicomonas sp.]|uniref:hypothetical protein n=1 Tax=uncultured Endozoicomonas sp. TaxID=432652 RepID=UPI002629DF4F|nr:hypothetical protein [uncultured Endozoicomonas sp.]
MARVESPAPLCMCQQALNDMSDELLLAAGRTESLQKRALKAHVRYDHLIDTGTFNRFEASVQPAVNEYIQKVADRATEPSELQTRGLGLRSVIYKLIEACTSLKYDASTPEEDADPNDYRRRAGRALDRFEVQKERLKDVRI